MSRIDSSVARVLDRPSRDTNNDEDEDDLIEALEKESEHDVSGLRERRLQQLHEEVVRARIMRDQGSTGGYQEIKDEKAIMDITTQTKLVVVHFFRSDFNRCRILDTHLEVLAPKHFDTRFLRINVDNCPFLVAKLKIQVLPTLLAFVNGTTVDRVLGFEGVGRGGDNFKTWQLEGRLLQSGVLLRQKMAIDDVTSRSHMGRGSSAVENEEDYDDWE